MGELDNVSKTISDNIDVFDLPGVVAVRAGYRIVNGWPTKEPTIAVLTDDGQPPAGLVPEVAGVATQVRKADPMEEMAAKQNDRHQTLSLNRPEFVGSTLPLFVPSSASPGEPMPEATRPTAPQIPYSGPAGVELHPISGQYKILCHASPDAGWPTLKSFLADTQSTLTVGMYDFTSAHILNAFIQSEAGKKVTLTLDHPAKNPTADQTDEETEQDLKDAALGDFEFGWAMVRGHFPGRPFIYNSAYHIKVAVRDSDVVWLSSGNWNNSNQPDFTPSDPPTAADQATAKSSDRDWHVIISQADIAAQFEAFLKNDEKIAADNPIDGGAGALAAIVAVPDLARVATGDFKFFPPLEISGEDLTITPLLTPDPTSYRPNMLALIESAQKSLFIQLQYIHPPKEGVDTDFGALIDAVAKKISDGLDVRIICSEFQPLKGGLEQLQDAGISLDNVKIQNHVHNKGFVIDASSNGVLDSAKVALGSENWSGDGVLRNRDASVIIENKKAALYYATIFEHDWDVHAKKEMG